MKVAAIAGDNFFSSILLNKEKHDISVIGSSVGGIKQHVYTFIWLNSPGETQMVFKIKSSDYEL